MDGAVTHVYLLVSKCRQQCRHQPYFTAGEKEFAEKKEKKRYADDLSEPDREHRRDLVVCGGEDGVCPDDQVEDRQA